MDGLGVLVQTWWDGLYKPAPFSIGRITDNNNNNNNDKCLDFT